MTLAPFSDPNLKPLFSKRNDPVLLGKILEFRNRSPPKFIKKELKRSSVNKTLVTPEKNEIRDVELKRPRSKVAIQSYRASHRSLTKPESTDFSVFYDSLEAIYTQDNMYVPTLGTVITQPNQDEVIIPLKDQKSSNQKQIESPTSKKGLVIDRLPISFDLKYIFE